MTREILGHSIDPEIDKIKIIANDHPGPGGANHRYVIVGYDPASNTSLYPQLTDEISTVLLFQNGPIPKSGVNGITNEVLLAIVADRLRSFQLGKFSCRENTLALTKIEEALHWLHHRTRARMERGVEGTYVA